MEASTKFHAANLNKRSTSEATCSSDT